MELFEAIFGRRSVRAFEREEVPEEYLRKLIDAARFAPSAGNLQPWEFVVVRSEGTKRALAEAALRQYFIEEAPLVIVVCANEVRSGRYYGERGAKLYCLQDTAAAVQNILLAAHGLGLGACWVGAFREAEVARVIGAPAGVRPVAIVPIGFPREKPKAPPRRSLKEIIHEERLRAGF
ncbi:TPA: nitroreductase family protein [Candidatus Bathyarchaeota archaeon]|nr:nitroreductase family protein [Candidatus Bathyarchaeota archaeon]